MIGGAGMKRERQRVVNILVLLITLSFVTACGKDPEFDINEEPFSLSIMSITHSGEPLPPDSLVKKKIEEYTNTKIDFIWVPNSTYEDKLNITLASRELPTIITVDKKRASIIQATRAGLFWELESYLKEYPNLSQADPIVLQNTAIDGKIYGVYRSRPIGRNGITYRKDWAENLRLGEIKTIEDFYQMLKAFTYEDPDGNGKMDTYGLAMSKYSGPWDIMSTWFGAPNQWGEDSKGRLVPAHKTNEYREALQFFRALYEENLVTQDFAVLDSSMWMEDVKKGQAGVVVDVLDHAQRLQEESNQNQRGSQYDVIGAVEGPKGLRNLHTSGYLGFHAITKSGAKTEGELKKTLRFLDQLNDREMQIILNNGIEDRHFKVVDGYAIPYGDDPQLLKETKDINQLHMGIPGDLFYVVKDSPIRDKIQMMIEENKKIVINNPAEGLTSDIWSQKGKGLDDILDNARVRYIMGQMNEDELEQAYGLWEQAGGLELIEELNQLYK